ncbi:MAG: PadR family transcriptional regulator [Candidatus Micrarchaeota archaeon]
MPKDCNPKMRFFMKGFAEMFILAEISQKPTSGKELMDAITHITDGEWCPSPGATYPLLRKMEADGLIKCKLEPSKGRRKILYFATAKGTGRLTEHRKRLVEKSEKMVRMMMHLLFHVLHPRGSKSANKLDELSDLIVWNRSYMLSLPDRDIEPELDRMISIFTKLKKERERK